jgi:hypothetical protein
MTARNFVWLSIGGGAWSLASDWDDITDGISPSLIAPGSADSVTVTGPSGSGVQTITGPGAAASAMFAGNSMLSGAFSFGTLTLGAGGAGGLLGVGTLSSLQAGGATIASGSLLAGAGGRMMVAGALQLGGGAGSTSSAALEVTGGAEVSALSLSLTGAADSLYVDASSVLEVGTAGDGEAGQLTVDAGATLIGQGDADEYGALTDDGTIEATGGTLSVGALSGGGTLAIAGGAVLALNGACGAGVTVEFAGANATLAIAEEFYAPAGTLTGFSPGDAIDVLGSQISAASFTPSSAAGGVLTLYYGAQVAARLDLAGTYTGSVFLTGGDGAGGTLISEAPASGGGGSPSPGTGTPDQYAWVAGGSGAWNRAGNWQDLTAGTDPAAVAPGANDLATIAGGLDEFWVIGGPANAASLAVTGEVALSGTFGIGTLSVGSVSAGGFTDGTLDLLAGTEVGAGSVAIQAGGVTVAGSASLLSVAGTLALGGGELGVGLPVTALDVAAGGIVQAGAVLLGGGSGDSITTDPTARLEVGDAGAAEAGAVTVDAGAGLGGNGDVNPFGLIVDNGSILASGGTLTLGSVSGSGTLGIAGGATLELLATTALPITLQATGATLAFAGDAAAPSGTVSGLVPGDLIHLEGSSVTNVVFTQSTGVLTLSYQGTVVARLTLAGIPAGDKFVTTPDGSGGTDIGLTSGSGGGGGGGQTGTDALAWRNPVSGAWGKAANWTDVTLNAVATAPPGAQTPALVAGPTGASFQEITGPGSCASLTFTGNTVLSGVFSTGMLTVGTPGESPVAGELDVFPGSSLSATAGLVASGDLLSSGPGTDIAVGGTLTVGSAGGLAVLAAQDRGAVQVGGLALDAGSATADASSTLEVGSAGGAAAGVVTIDAGFAVSGNGSLNGAGAVTDNGLIDAEGGILSVGELSGAGSVSIGVEAGFALVAGAACPILFAGGGATLILPGTAEGLAASLQGFAPGDSIVIAGSPVDGVSYAPGPGGVGTLTLTYGGVVAEQLSLAGNYAGDSFAVQPDGEGAAITVQSQGGGTPPQGTATPDQYVWTGADSTQWADPGNWNDLTQGQSPAAVAPGQNDLVAIAGPVAGVLDVVGPADAAALALSGTVALSGSFALGSLSVGGTAPGLLELGAGGAVTADASMVAGALVVNGGALTVLQTLTLGGVGAAGVLSAGAGSQVDLLGAVLLASAESDVAAQGGGAVEIGGSAGAQAGSVTVDPGGLLQGQGAAGLSGQVIDNGTICASVGTLALGSVSGGGTLLVGEAAELVLTGSAGGSLTAEFSGAGTLSFLAVPADGQFAPAILDFGPGDEILLPEGGVTSAAYALTGPGEGVLSLFNGGSLVAQVTLLGNEAGLGFSVTGAAGGSILTTEPDNMSGQGGDTVTSPISTGQITRGDLLSEFLTDFAYVPETMIGDVVGVEGIYQYYSTDGTPPSETVFGAGYGGPGVNIEVVAPLNSVVGASGYGPEGTALALQPGYSALIAEGTENIGLTDKPNTLAGVPGLGDALLVSNYGNDTLDAQGDNDTLVGAPGANTTFYAELSPGAPAGTGINVYVQGGGNDSIATNTDNAAITTSGGRSVVYIGASDNDVMSYGSDSIIGSDDGVGNDTVVSLAPAGQTGDTVFSPVEGYLFFTGGDAPSILVGNGGLMDITGGAANGNIVWGGSSDVYYHGGTGSALVVGGSSSQASTVQGGSGPITVFGGTGPGVYSGGTGSVFVLGAGASTVTAAAGNTVFITGGAPVSVTGVGSNVLVYAGPSTADNVFQAGTGNETLWGGAGNDLFNVGNGNEILTGDGGDDVFSYTNGVASGQSVIVGFVPGQDTIALHGYGDTPPPVTVAFGDSIVHLNGGVEIVVLNVTNLPSSSFTLS